MEQDVPGTLLSNDYCPIPILHMIPLPAVVG